MLRVTYNDQEYDAIGIYDTGNGDGTIAVLVGVRLFLSGAGSYSDPIPVGEVTVLNGGTSSGAGVGSLNTLTGDITLAAGSNVTLTPSGNTITIAAAAGTPGSNTVTTAMIQDGAITTAKIADGTIQPADLAPGAINTYLNTNGSGVVGWVTLPSSSGVTSFNGRTGAVTPQGNDYTAALVGAIDEDLLGTANGVAPLDNSSKVPYANLPVGTAANTIARGDDPRFGQSSFITRSDTKPSSPSAGDIWYRYTSPQLAELEDAWVYTTRLSVNAWRSLEPFIRQFEGASTTGSPAAFLFSPYIPQAFKAWFYRLGLTAYVATTNNASNYWTMTLASLDASYNVVTTIASLNTSGISPNTWNRLGYGRDSVNDFDGRTIDNTSGAEPVVRLAFTATGTPGALYFGADAYFRQVWTAS